MKGVLILISLVVVSAPTVCSQEAGPSTRILIGNRLERSHNLAGRVGSDSPRFLLYLLRHRTSVNDN